MSSPIVGYQQASSYTAAKDRQIQVHKLHHDAASGGIIPGRSGVIMGSGSNFDSVRNAGYLMQVDVAAGMAQVGTYAVAVGTGVSLTCQPSTSTARRDLVILRVYDQESGDGTSEAKIELVKGTTTADPALPARSLILAHCDIGANATQITVVDRRYFTSAAGGVVPMTAAYPVTYDQVAPGDQVYSLSSGNNWQRVGNSLVPLLGQAAQLTAIRTTNDATASGQWGVLLSNSGTMPAGTYLVIVSMNFYPEPAGTNYCWLQATVNGSAIGATQAYVCQKMNDSPTNVTSLGIYTHAGGTMTLNAQYGFANAQMWGAKGSQMTALRIGP